MFGFRTDTRSTPLSLFRFWVRRIASINAHDSKHFPQKKKPPGTNPRGFRNRRAKGLSGETRLGGRLASALLWVGPVKNGRGAPLGCLSARVGWLGFVTSVACSPLATLALGEVRSFWLSPAAGFSQPLAADRSRRETLARNVANPRHRPSATFLAADPVARPPRERISVQGDPPPCTTGPNCTPCCSRSSGTCSMCRCGSSRCRTHRTPARRSARRPSRPSTPMTCPSTPHQSR